MRVSVLLEVIGAVAAAYQVFAIAACLRFRWGRRSRPGEAPKVSILKAVRGLDPGFRAAIESHTKLHGEYELLCGVRSLDDPAVAVLREYPQVRVIECHTLTPNQKVGVLMDLAQQAKHP